MVKENLTNYSKRSIEQVDKARELQATFNNISTKNMLKRINNNMVKDLPIKRQDIKVTETIYCPNIYALKGKTVNRKADHVVAPITGIPEQILKEYKYITLCIDVMFINGLKFLPTVSRHLDFVTA